MPGWNKKVFGWVLITVFILGMTGFNANPWRIRINIPEFRLHLYKDNQLYQSFYIAVGRPDKPSPVGDFWIASKTTNPTWYPTDGRPPVPPGPTNPLGKYWMGLNINGYGIHGNSASWSIGNPVSRGCFRMYNDDVAKLFSFIPLGTPVQIVYQTVFGRLDAENQVWLEIYPDIYHRVNQENAVREILGAINWNFEPHYKAINELLRWAKPLKILVPKVIAVTGDLETIDGFWWNNDWYLPKNMLSSWNLKLETPDPGEQFQDYLNVKKISTLMGKQIKTDWDPSLNLLKIYRLKIFLNGNEIIGAGRQDTNGRLLLDLSKLAAIFKEELTLDQNSSTAVCKGDSIQGQIFEGGFWVDLPKIKDLWSELQYQWEESTWTLYIKS